MANLKGTDKAESLRASNASDSVSGAGGDDVIVGLGGSDTLSGGDGNDAVHGDGTYTVADAVRETGGAVIPIGGSSGQLNFTSMGMTADWDGLSLSVWRLRNQTASEQIVTVKVHGTATAFKVVVPAGTDTFFTSPLTGTFIASVGSWSSTKATNTRGTFSYDQAYGDSPEGNDTIDGGAGDDAISGHAGNDYLTGGTGADLIDGGNGTDRADYRDSGQGVWVSLEKGAGSGGDAEGDALSNVENLSGSNHDDTLAGDAGTNRLVGRQGNDVLIGGGGDDTLLGGSGADHHDGGAGMDTADYSSSWAAVTVDLLNGTGSGAEAKGDTYASVEKVMGSAYGDTLSGDDAVNRLNGGNGDDVLAGNGGNDYLIGGAGGDTQTGGAGQDVFVFAESAFGTDTITDFAAGAGRTDRVWLTDQGVSSFADVLARMSDSGEGAVLTLGGGQILFAGVAVAAFAADDFIF